MQPEVRNVHAVIATLAANTHGVVTRPRLLAAGLSVMQVRRLVAQGALIPVHRGVYRVGHAAPSVEATYMAAVLAGGRGALLGGTAAAHLLSMISGAPPRPTVWAPGERCVPGVRTRRSYEMGAWGRWIHRGIPVVPPGRILVDLTATLPLGALARACHQAQVLHRLKPDTCSTVAGSARH
jgi:hypothetical protein